MTKYLLAFLTLAATAYGQDSMLQSQDYWTLGSSLHQAWMVRRVSFPDTEVLDWRSHLTFKIPDVGSTFSSATLQLALGWRVSNDNHSARCLIRLNDAASYDDASQLSAGEQNVLYEDISSGAYYGHVDRHGRHHNPSTR